MLPKLKVLGASGCSVPRAAVREALGGDAVAIPFVWRKFYCTE